MEENVDQTLGQSPEKIEFQLKNEDFPKLQSTAPPKSRQTKNENPTGIVNELSKIVNEPSGIKSELNEINEIMNRPIGIVNDPSGIKSGPSGIISKLSGIMSGPSGIISRPSGIMSRPSGIMSGQSGFMSGPSGIMIGPSGIMSGPSRIMSGPSGMMSGPSGMMSGPIRMMSGPSGITMPITGTSSTQMNHPNVGFVPRSGSYFSECLQPGPRMNIPIYPDNTVRNIPPNMMTDQFGMLGLLSAFRGMQVNPALATLAIGEDPVNMGLGMNNQLMVPDSSGRGRREIHLNYGGPWADKPNHPPHTETRIPDEYRTNLLLGDKLAQLKFPLLEEDALFYLFYNYPSEQYQIAAAYELYVREWRYHKVKRVWLRRFDYQSVTEYTPTYEKGLYNVFDPVQWRKLPMNETLLYKDLESKPALPPDMKIYF